MLAVDDPDLVDRDELSQPAREAGVEPFVLEVVAQPGDVRRVSAELDDPQAVVSRFLLVATGPGGDLHHQHAVAAVAKPACELVGAPPAATADRWERIGRQQDVHGVGDIRTRKARSSASQWARQL